VSSSTGEYIAAADISTTTGTNYQFIFEFGSEGTVSVDLSGYAATGIQLDELVSEINSAVLADTGTYYAAASALYD
jgi:hypothetical protein